MDHRNFPSEQIVRLSWTSLKSVNRPRLPGSRPPVALPTLLLCSFLPPFLVPIGSESWWWHERGTESRSFVDWEPNGSLLLRDRTLLVQCTEIPIERFHVSSVRAEPAVSSAAPAKTTKFAQKFLTEPPLSLIFHRTLDLLQGSRTNSEVPIQPAHLNERCRNCAFSARLSQCRFSAASFLEANCASPHSVSFACKVTQSCRDPRPNNTPLLC